MADDARVLDPCCGSRMMWFDRGHGDVIFGDARSETITVTDRSHREDGRRTLQIKPDVMLDFRSLPYADGSFKLVAFDPPHLVRAGPRSWMAGKYGKLGPNWRDDLRAGFAECFRVLHADGVLVFKWNETQVKLGEILPLTPHRPLFGHTSGRGGLTHWLVFMKPPRTEAVMANNKPQRIQLSRRRGWRKPPNTIVVARPSRYGNPHRIGWCETCGIEHTRAEAIAEFEADLDEFAKPMLEPLRGKNLACWCKLDELCHADVLLRIANS